MGASLLLILINGYLPNVNVSISSISIIDKDFLILQES